MNTVYSPGVQHIVIQPITPTVRLIYTLQIILYFDTYGLNIPHIQHKLSARHCLTGHNLFVNMRFQLFYCFHVFLYWTFFCFKCLYLFFCWGGGGVVLVISPPPLTSTQWVQMAAHWKLCHLQWQLLLFTVSVATGSRWY